MRVGPSLIVAKRFFLGPFKKLLQLELLECAPYEWGSQYDQIFLHNAVTEQLLQSYSRTTRDE